MNSLLKAVLKYLERIATSDQAVWFMQNLIAVWWKVPVEIVKKVWDKLLALVEKAAEKYPGRSQGDKKYNWVLTAFLEWAKDEGFDLKIAVVDRIMDEVLGWLTRKGIKT